MPNDTNKTNDTQQTTDSTQTAVNTTSQQDTPPVLSVEEVVPPMPQVGLPPKNEAMPENTKTEETKQEESGSAAPSDDIKLPPVVMGTTPKKKFGSGKVIATILGLFLLVGGLGAGTMLVQQNQDIREQAAGGCGSNTTSSACGKSCSPVKKDGNSYECKWIDGECKESSKECGDGGGGGNTKDSCESSGGYWCDRVVDVYGIGVPAFCVSNSGNITCAQQANNLGYTVPTGGGGSGEGGYRCIVGQGRDYPYIAGTQCVLGNSIQNLGNSNPPPSCFCGTIQIDGGAYHGTYTSTCACGNNDNPTTPPAPTPTAPPVISAYCQDIKAYSTSGGEVPLTTTQLSALKPGDKVNLCAQGQKTGGYFDKIRWTINGVLQAEENVTDRVGQTTEGRFCKEYTIPATLPANGKFTFRAELHHITLGWK